jgi:flagellar hook-length control protein FliK
MLASGDAPQAVPVGAAPALIEPTADAEELEPILVDPAAVNAGAAVPAPVPGATSLPEAAIPAASGGAAGHGAMPGAATLAAPTDPMFAAAAADPQAADAELPMLDPTQRRQPAGNELPAPGSQLPPGAPAAGAPVESGSAPAAGIAAAESSRPSGQRSPRAGADTLVELLTAAGEPARGGPPAPGAAVAPAEARGASAFLAALPLPGPGVPGFEQAFGQRLIWMASQGVQDALVRVHPEHLGPIDIHIRVDGEQAELALAASHPSSREALELALPRLREQLADAGLQLVRAEVGGQQSGQDSRQDGAGRDRDPLRHEAAAPTLAGEAPLMAPRESAQVGMLDLFA